ncbi:MAG: enoyl-CoA hydratase [archaeon]|nr:enoyl-CoA hydratase [archaeon]
MKIEDFRDIIYEKEENGICTITLNMPKRRNALTHLTFLEIYTVLEDMEKDKKAKVLIITGCKEANAFSSGGYFKQSFMDEIMESSPELKDEIDLMDFAQKKLSMKFWGFNKPVIAALNGFAIGAGITMPLIGADFIFASEETWLGFYFVKRAICPEYGISYILPLYVGFQKAKEILYFGDKITATEAEKLGLVNKVLPPDQLLPHAREVAMRLIPPKGPPQSIGLMKKIMHSHYVDTLSKTLDLENQGNRLCFTSADFRESFKALGEKRDPEFIGRGNRQIREYMKKKL